MDFPMDGGRADNIIHGEAQSGSNRRITPCPMRSPLETFHPQLAADKALRAAIDARRQRPLAL